MLKNVKEPSTSQIISGELGNFQFIPKAKTGSSYKPNDARIKTYISRLPTE